MMLAAALLAVATQAPAACPLRPQWGLWQPTRQSAAQVNVLSGDAKGLMWNGLSVSDSTAGQYLQAVSVMRPHPILVLDVTGASCSAVEQMELLVESNGPCTPDTCLLFLSPTGTVPVRNDPPAFHQ